MLKWTYVYGYFLDENKDPVKKDFFEYQQANAEGVTERLARLLFDEVAKMKADELKNMIRVTRKVNFSNSYFDCCVCAYPRTDTNYLALQYIENLSKSLSEGFNEEIASGGTPGKAPLKTSIGAKVPKQALKPIAQKAAGRGKT